MPIKTYTEQLEEVQAKITTILNGAQEYRTSAGNSKKEAELAVLFAQEKRLMSLAQRESSGRSGPKVRYVEVGS